MFSSFTLVSGSVAVFCFPVAPFSLLALGDAFAFSVGIVTLLSSTSAFTGTGSAFSDFFKVSCAAAFWGITVNEAELNEVRGLDRLFYNIIRQ